MKAIGNIKYRRVAPYTPWYTHRPYYGPSRPFPYLVCPSLMSEENWHKVYLVDVELHPVDNFCPGMDYSHMETPDSVVTTKLVTIELDITPALIVYLEDLGDTDQTVIKGMREAIGYKGVRLDE